jgi:hypothetical protein
VRDKGGIRGVHSYIVRKDKDCKRQVNGYADEGRTTVCEALESDHLRLL